MKKLWLSILATIIVGLGISGFAFAQTQITPAQLWSQFGAWLQPTNINQGIRIGSGFPFSVDKSGKATTSNISVTSLTPGNCVQAGAGGLLTTVIAPCGSGSLATTTINGFSGPNFTFSTTTVGSATLKITGSGSTINFGLDTSALQPAGSYVTNSYASSTFPSFSYASSTYQAQGNYITALTGDITASGPGSVAATLATVNGNVGPFGGVSSIPSFTVNAKGLITAAAANTPSIPVGDITGILPVTNGGTGVNKITANDIIFGNTSNPIATSSNLTWDGTKFSTTNASTTNLTVSTNAYFTGLSNGCANITGGLLGSTGVACGSGGGSITTSSVQSIIFPLLANGTVAGVNATSSSTSFLIQGTGALNPLTVNSSTGATLLTVLANGNIGINVASPTQILDVEKAYTTSPTQDQSVISSELSTYGTKTNILDRRHDFFGYAGDAANVNQINIIEASSSTPIVINTASTTGYSTGDRITVYGVGGNTAANGSWVITVASSTGFSLNGSTGNGAYTSGGVVTNRSSYDGMNLYINPIVARGGINQVGSDDDVNGIVVTNTGTAKMTDVFYTSACGGVVGDCSNTVYANQMQTTYLLQDLATHSIGIDLGGGTYTSAAIALPNNSFIAAKNTSAALQNLIGMDSSNQLSLYNGGVLINSSGQLGIGAAPDTVFRMHSGTDQNLRIFGAQQLSSGTYMQSANDAVNAFEGFQIEAGTILLNYFNQGNVAIGTTTTPANTLTVIGSISSSALTAGDCVQAGAGGVLTSSASPCGSGSGGNSAFTVGNGLIYNATSTDSVGIGTTTPSGYSLVVSPPLNSALNLFYAASSTGQGLVISNAGNVGIGTTTPGSFLTVGGGTNTTAGRGINFGDATADLYRSAAGIVKTDGALTVQGTLTVQTQINSGTNLTVNLATPAANTNAITFQTNSNIVAASGVVNGIRTGFNFVPASGSGSFNGLIENDGINQAPIVSQTASTTGIFISPNLVRAMDYRALVTAPYIWNLATTTTLSQAYGSLFNAYTLATTSTTTITNAGNIVITGAPIASSSSITIASSTALNIQGGSVVKSSGVVNNAYSLFLQAPTGATNNYAAVFNGGNVGIGSSSPNSNLVIQGSSGQANSILFNVASSTGASLVSAGINVNGVQLGVNTTTGMSIINIVGNASNSTFSYLTVASTSGATIFNINSDGNIYGQMFGGLPGTPTVATSTGIGTTCTAGQCTPVVTGSDLAGFITFTTGSTPATSAVIFTITFNKSGGYSPQLICATFPSNAGSALTISDEYASTTSATTFTLNSDTSALTGSTVYQYTYQCLKPN